MRYDGRLAYVYLFEGLTFADGTELAGLAFGDGDGRAGLLRGGDGAFGLTRGDGEGPSGLARGDGWPLGGLFFGAGALGGDAAFGGVPGDRSFARLRASSLVPDCDDRVYMRYPPVARRDSALAI
jgi:hypothetical protein